MKDKTKTYTYKIIDDRYLEMGGKPYEYGEEELLSFAAHEIDLFLFYFTPFFFFPFPLNIFKIEFKWQPSPFKGIKIKTTPV